MTGHAVSELSNEKHRDAPKTRVTRPLSRNTNGGCKKKVKNAVFGPLQRSMVSTHERSTVLPMVVNQ